MPSPFSFSFCFIHFFFPSIFLLGVVSFFPSFFLFQQGIGSRQLVSLQGSRWIHNYIKGIKEGRSRHRHTGTVYADGIAHAI